MLVPEQNLRRRRDSSGRPDDGVMLMAMPGAGLNTPADASTIPLRNFRYPKRILCVNFPVVKSVPTAYAGVWSTFANG